jgi:hypothetical protein
MAFRLNRPFGIGKFVKLRVNKKSLGLQVGGKYLKGTINTKGQATGSIGGAGTGMYIQKTKNLKKNAKSEHKSKRIEQLEEIEEIYKVNKKFPLELSNLLSNEALLMMPKNKEIDRLHNLFHSTNNDLEKLHTNQEVINFQKELICFGNFIVQDFAEAIKSLAISDIGNLNDFSLEKYNQRWWCFHN